MYKFATNFPQCGESDIFIQLGHIFRKMLILSKWLLEIDTLSKTFLKNSVKKWSKKNTLYGAGVPVIPWAWSVPPPSDVWEMTHTTRRPHTVVNIIQMWTCEGSFGNRPFQSFLYDLHFDDKFWFLHFLFLFYRHKEDSQGGTLPESWCTPCWQRNRFTEVMTRPRENDVLPGMDISLACCWREN